MSARPNLLPPRIARWIDLVISELRKGDRADANVAVVSEAHGDRVIPVDHAIAEEWGRMNAPDPLPVVDGLLAATARVLGLTLVTRNVADVAGTQVQLLNPFAG